MTPDRRRFLAGLSVLAIGPLLAACGTDDSSSPATDPTDRTADPTGRPSTDAGDEAVFPATLTHKFGETTVEKAPERVVVVGLVEQDALLALGVVPVAVTYWFGEAPGQIFPWATDALGDAPVPTVLKFTDGIEVEQVAAQEPDLIIGIYSGMTKAEYDLLSKLAPTVAQSAAYADYGSPWDVSTLAVGAAVGRPDAAQQVVDDVEGQVRAVADAHPEWRGKEAAVVTPYEGLYVYGPQDVRTRLLGELGFTFPERLQKEGTEDFGWALSAERTRDLAGLDAVVWFDLAGADKGMTALWEGTDTFAQGRFVDISDEDGAYYVATSMVTPLSIPYNLERYVPQLEAMTDGDPATKPPAAAA